jgi:drug/metabolite transporter (DMT)-like permease
MIPAALVVHGPFKFAPVNLGLQITRGLLIAASTLLYIAAVSGAPVAETTAIIFVYPFIMLMLAPWALGERNSGSSWFAICAGFVGVLLIMRPGFGSLNWHGLLALAAGFTIGGHFLVTRRIGDSAPPLITAAITAVVGLVMLTFALPLSWQPFTWTHVFLGAVIGVTATISQILMVIACNKADMSTLAPFSFAEILFAAFIGYVLFREFPDASAWAGISIVAASGLYVASIQRVRRQAELRPRRTF